jgi:uncharacterized membrane protein
VDHPQLDRPDLPLGSVPVHPPEPGVLDAGRVRRAVVLLAQTRQADRDKLEAERIDQRHTELERAAATRTAAIKAETERLSQLLEANTALTKQDKELTEHVARLSREIHALLTNMNGS